MNIKTYSIILLSLISFNTILGQGNPTSKQPGNVTLKANANIEKLVEIKFSENYGDDYKIQLYYGNLNKAHEVLRKFDSNYPELTSKILFETPNYKVWVGNFRTRLEADKALMNIRKKFSSAFIFKPKKQHQTTNKPH